MTEQVEMLQICKSFGGVHALNKVDFKVRAGEIHALTGENGAGKSTLIKILAGAYTADSGTIKLNGEKVHITDPKSGKAHGVSVIYQEFALAPDLTVAENIYLDGMNTGGMLINWNRLRKSSSELLTRLGFPDINVTSLVSDLSISYQQVVEIAKALSSNAKVLVLDEPTAVLATTEVKQLFRLLKDLKESGMSIIYISHRMEEIFEICDRVTVLKDGEYVDTLNISDTDKNSLVALMVGRTLQGFFPEREARIGEVVFEAKDICIGDAIQDISFTLRAGEVVGLTGLVGAGRTEVARAIFGVDKKTGGELYLNGEKIQITSPKKAFRNGVGYLPEDRKNHGVLLEFSVANNVTLTCLHKYLKTFMSLIDFKKEDTDVTNLVSKLQIKTAGNSASVMSLSGGNQQKVAFAKLVSSNCKVMILDEPTRGVDVGAKIEIYKYINEMAKQGVAILMISSEMQEIIGMCDTVIVMRHGKITGNFNQKEITENNLIQSSMGVN